MKSTSKWLLIPIFLSLIALCSCENSVMEDIEESEKLLSSRKGESRNGEVEKHVFPYVYEIMESPIVIEHMNLAWEKMLSLVRPYYDRQEVGFYIYYNHETKKFWIGDMVIGPRVSYDSDEPANVSLGPAKNNLQVCA